MGRPLFIPCWICALVLLAFPLAADGQRFLNLDPSGEWVSLCPGETFFDPCRPCEELPRIRPFQPDRPDTPFTVVMRASNYEENEGVVTMSLSGRLDWFWDFKDRGEEVSPGFCQDPVCAPRQCPLENRNYVVERHTYDLDGSFRFDPIRDSTNTARLDFGDTPLVSSPGFGFQTDWQGLQFTLWYEDPDPAVIRGPHLTQDFGTRSPPLNDPVCVQDLVSVVPACFLRTTDALLPEESGDLSGQLRSSEQTNTACANEVHRANLVLFEQTGGPVREQATAETLEDYRAYLESRGLRAVDTDIVQYEGVGLECAQKPNGKFLFRRANLASVRRDLDGQTRWRTTLHALLIQNAETDENRVDADGFPIPGTDTLYFESRIIPNLIAGGSELQIDLAPLRGTGSKRSIALRLSALCPDHYQPVESLVIEYLNAIDTEQIELTEARDEGIRRGVWAERAAALGVDFSEEMISLSLEGLANLLGDLFNDLADFTRADIKAKRKLREALGSDIPIEISDGLKLSSIPESYKRALLGEGMSRILDQGDMAGGIKSLIGVLKPALTAALEKAGIQTADAATITKAFILTANALADGVQTRTRSGAAKGLLKQLLSAAVKAATPILLDRAPLSYCDWTKESLEVSNGRIQAWDDAVDSDYEAARGRVVEVLRTMNDESSETLRNYRVTLALAGGFGAVESGGAVIGKAIKWVKVVEKVAKVAKYLSNTATMVVPVKTAYGSVADAVEEATYRAFGEELPEAQTAAVLGSRAAQRFAGPAADHLVSLDATNLLAALVSVHASLGLDDLGAALAAAVDPGTASYLSARDDLRSQLRALFAQISSVALAGAASGATRAVTDVIESRSDWQVVEANLAELLDRIFTAAITAEYTGADDPAYRADRDLALAAIAALEVATSSLLSGVEDLRSALGAAELRPVVLAETESLLSNVSGNSRVVQTPEEFTLSVRVRNLDDAPKSQLGAKLAIVQEADRLAILGDAIQTVGSGTLGPNGEASVEWSLAYSGNLAAERFEVVVELLEDGDAPMSFEAVGAQWTLVVEPPDGDNDGMPDAFETAHGLDPGVDDSLLDPDGDGLLSLDEFVFGTRPDKADTDEDGLNDREEIESGADGFRTDPLESDTDGDGVEDSSDGAPTEDGAIEAEPDLGEPVVVADRSRVSLGVAESVQTVRVSNAGSGTLLWRASAEDPAILDVSPTAGGLRSNGDLLFITPAAGTDLEAMQDLETRVTLVDSGGRVRDAFEIVVRMPEPGRGPAIAALALALTWLARARRRAHAQTGCRNGSSARWARMRSARRPRRTGSRILPFPDESRGSRPDVLARLAWPVRGPCPALPESGPERRVGAPVPRRHLLRPLTTRDELTHNRAFQPGRPDTPDPSVMRASYGEKAAGVTTIPLGNLLGRLRDFERRTNPRRRRVRGTDSDARRSGFLSAARLCRFSSSSLAERFCPLHDFARSRLGAMPDSCSRLAARCLAALVTIGASLCLAETALATPLNLANTAPREVLLRFEVGDPFLEIDFQTPHEAFGDPIVVPFASDGTIATIELSAPVVENHLLAARSFADIIPGSASAGELSIDVASGAVEVGFSFDTVAFFAETGPFTVAVEHDSRRSGGFLPSFRFCDTPPRCTFVPGEPYDPETGLLLAVGEGSVSGLGSALFVFDAQLSEVPEPGTGLLLMLGVVALARRSQRPRVHVVGLPFLMFLFAACNDPRLQITRPESGALVVSPTVRVDLAFDPPLASGEWIRATLERGVDSVSGPAVEDVSQDLAIASDRASAVLEVMALPPGRSALRFQRLASEGEMPTATAEIIVDRGGFHGSESTPFNAGARYEQLTRRSSLPGGADRQLDVAIWYPTEQDDSPQRPIERELRARLDAPPPAGAEGLPLVLYSHGLCGWEAEAGYLASDLARAGFVIAAITHPPSTILDIDPPCDSASSTGLSFFERPGDLSSLLDALIAWNEDPAWPLAGALDPERVGISGFSFGADSTSLVAAVDLATRDPRFRAAMALAPSASGFTTPLGVPTLIQGGSLDDANPFAAQQAVYDKLLPPRWLVRIENAGHRSFANDCQDPLFDCVSGTLPQSAAHPLVQRYARGFLGRYVAGDVRWETLLTPVAGVSLQSER